MPFAQQHVIPGDIGHFAPVLAEVITFLNAVHQAVESQQTLALIPP
jgi:hypothetical protein